MNTHLPSFILMLLLLAMSGFFSATETAFSSLNKTRIKALAEDGNASARHVLSLAERYDALISTILIGNNIVNIALTAVATMFFIGLYGDIGATYATLIVTVVVLIFGEISPKSIAKDCPEKFAIFTVQPMRLLVWLMTPANTIFAAWKKCLSRLLKLSEREKMSQQELLMLVDEVQQDGAIDNQESELLKNAIEFTDLRADEILTPRVNIEAVPANASKDAIAQKFAETKYSRLPVFEGSIDNIVGVIHQKDFYVGSGITGRKIREIITVPTFVHKSAKISELLKQLQASKAHVAVVLDEYGGTYGIVTMEDILEQLVGDIWDEHDEITETFRPVGDDTFAVDGATYLEDFCQFFGFKTDSEVVSVSGWVMEQLGTIPTGGETFSCENLDIRVTELDNRRVARIEVHVRKQQEA